MLTGLTTELDPAGSFFRNLGCSGPHHRRRRAERWRATARSSKIVYWWLLRVAVAGRMRQLKMVSSKRAAEKIDLHRGCDPSSRDLLVQAIDYQFGDDRIAVVGIHRNPLDFSEPIGGEGGFQIFDGTDVVMKSGLHYDVLDVQFGQHIRYLFRLHHVLREAVLEIDCQIAKQQLVDTDDAQVGTPGIGTHPINESAVPVYQKADIGFRRGKTRHHLGRLPHTGNIRHRTGGQRLYQYAARQYKDKCIPKPESSQ